MSKHTFSGDVLHILDPFSGAVIHLTMEPIPGLQINRDGVIILSNHHRMDSLTILLQSYLYLHWSKRQSNRNFT